MKTSHAILLNFRNDLDQSYKILNTIPIWVRVLVAALYIASIPVEQNWGFAFDTTLLRASIAVAVLFFAFRRIWPNYLLRHGSKIWFIQSTLALPFTYGSIVVMNAALTPEGASLNVLPITEYSLCLFFMIQLNRTITVTLLSWLLGSALSLCLLLTVENPNVALVVRSIAYSLPFVVTVFTLGGIVQNALARAQQEKEDAIWRIAMSIAHQLRTPLASVQNTSIGVASYFSSLVGGYKAAIDSGASVDQINEQKLNQIEVALETIGNEVESAKKLIDILIANSKPFQADVDSTMTFDVEDVITNALETFPFNNDVERGLISMSGSTFDVRANKHLFLHVLYNLVANAVEFAQKKRGGVVKITTEIGLRWNKINVWDNGVGIPQKNLNQIFEPFFSKNSMNGTGIGLPFCKSVIESIGGRISVKSTEGEYTEFTIRLPKVLKTPS
ncbi:MAG: HAMP domain-containing sensor histidine kinase [Pseudomonadales bacterium]